MTFEIILVAIVLILCIAADKFSGSSGIDNLSVMNLWYKKTRTMSGFF